MPTIIERIAAAEADADSLKHNAQEAAAAALAAAEDDAAASLRIAREEAKAGLALAAAMAGKEADTEAARIMNGSRLKADVLISSAEKKVGEAVESILEQLK